MDTTTDWTGRDVISRDGQQIGTVKEVHGGYFHVDVSMAPDYWLSSLYAVSADATGIRLTLAKDEIDLHKIDKPGMEPVDAMAGHRSDAILSDQQALEQRERMERELAIQNSGRA